MYINNILIKLFFLYNIYSNYFNLIYSANFKIINKCLYNIDIYSHENFKFNNKCNLNSNNECIISYNQISSGLIKTTLSEKATLFEFTINDKGIWYDLSVIPPGSGNCYSYEECIKISNKIGYNIPIEVNINKPSNSCVNLICLYDKCPDAYLYPFDDIKTKYCTLDTDFVLIYCPNNNSNNQNNNSNNNFNNSNNNSNNEIEFDCD
jgi:hypothetical protein